MFLKKFAHLQTDTKKYQSIAELLSCYTFATNNNA